MNKEFDLAFNYALVVSLRALALKLGSLPEIPQFERNQLHRMLYGWQEKLEKKMATPKQ